MERGGQIITGTLALAGYLLHSVEEGREEARCMTFRENCEGAQLA
jgi:hypothetical protein